MERSKILFYFLISFSFLSCKIEKEKEIYTEKLFTRMSYGIDGNNIFLVKNIPLIQLSIDDLQSWNWKQDNFTKEAINDLILKGFLENKNIQRQIDSKFKIIDSLIPPCPVDGIYIYMSDLGISLDDKHAVSITRLVKFKNCEYTHFREFLVSFKKMGNEWDIDGVGMVSHKSKDTLELPNITGHYGKREWE